MKDRIFGKLRKAALPGILALTLTMTAGAAERGGHSGGGHYGGGTGHSYSAPARGFSGGGSYRGGHDFDRGGYRGGYYRGGGYYGGGLYFGYGAPYSYGYAYPAPAPCGYYDQFGNWIPTACPVY